MLLLDQQLGNLSHLLLALGQNQEGQYHLLPAKAVGDLLGQMTAVDLITEQGQAGSQQEVLEGKDLEGTPRSRAGRPSLRQGAYFVALGNTRRRRPVVGWP